MDEATPHLHIDFVPYITESKRGVDTRVSLKQALGVLGFKGGSRGDTELNQWIHSEKQQLAMVMERHGIEWEQKGSHEEHMSVLEFKKKERAKEVATLEAEKEEAMAKAEQAIKAAENAARKAEQAQKDLREIAPLVDKVKSFAGEYGRPAEELLPEAGKIETGRSYREKKAIPFFKKLMEKLFSLYLAYCRLQDKYSRLSSECDRIWNKKERLERRCEEMEEYVEKLEPVVQDYDRIRNFFGHSNIDEILREVKEQERLKAEAEKERRRMQRKNQRDSR